jgi:hypothetical protein
MAAKVIKAIIVFPGAGISADDAERIQSAKPIISHRLSRARTRNDMVDHACS